MNSVHPLLVDLDPDQQALVRIIGRPWVRNELGSEKGWPVWDFVRRRFTRNRSDARPVDEVLASLPIIASQRFTGGSYGLWWRSEPNRPGLGAEERIGLTIPGLHHLQLDRSGEQAPDLLAICIDIIRQAARSEDDLAEDSDWTKVASGELRLSKRFAGAKPSPEHIVGQVLVHEFWPLAMPTAQFEYSVRYGPGDLRRFTDVTTIENYLAAVDAVAVVGEVDQLPTSPLGLPAALDHLGLALMVHPQWPKNHPPLDLPDFDAAASILHPPQTRAEFDQRCSDLWNILSRLRVPAATDDQYRQQDWDPAHKASLNNLQLWLRAHLGQEEFDTTCREAIGVLRALGRVRQGSQHAGSNTRRKREDALASFGLQTPVTNWPAAWSSLHHHAAAAVYVVAVAVRRATATVT